MTWGGLKIKENCHVLINQFHGAFRSKPLCYRKIMSVFRDVKSCFNASWGLKGLKGEGLVTNLFHKTGTYANHRLNRLMEVDSAATLTAKLFNFNFHPFEVVSRWRDPQLQVSENYPDLTECRPTYIKSFWLLSLFIFTRFKSWHVMC